jgi:hypothetical protein
MDFEVAIIGTDYAEVEIQSNPNSTLIDLATYDSLFVQTIHFTNISRGKYIILAYCPYKNLKNNIVSKVIDYSGVSRNYDLYFDKRFFFQGYL